MNKVWEILAKLLRVVVGTALILMGSCTIISSGIDLFTETSSVQELSLFDLLLLIGLSGLIGVLLLILGIRLVNTSYKSKSSSQNPDGSIVTSIETDDIVNNKQKILTTLVLLSVIVIFMGIGYVAKKSRDDYEIRAQVNEAITLFSDLKPKLTDYFVTYEEWPAFFHEIILPSERSGLSGNFVENIYIEEGHHQSGLIVIQVVFKKTGINPELSGKTLAFSSSDQGKSWNCGLLAKGNTTVPAIHLPPKCNP